MNPQQKFYLNQIDTIYKGSREGRAAVIAVAVMGISITAVLGIAVVLLTG